MIEPKWLVLTEVVGYARLPEKRNVAVRHILEFHEKKFDDERYTVVRLAARDENGDSVEIKCIEPVETIQAWLAGKPAPAPPPKRVKTIYPIEALYGRSMATVGPAIRRFDPTATDMPGPGTGEITVECEERHRAVVDELFKPPPSREMAFADTDRPADPPKPLDGEKQGS